MCVVYVECEAAERFVIGDYRVLSWDSLFERDSSLGPFLLFLRKQRKKIWCDTGDLYVWRTNQYIDCVGSSVGFRDLCLLFWRRSAEYFFS